MDGKRMLFFFFFFLNLGRVVRGRVVMCECGKD